MARPLTTLEFRREMLMLAIRRFGQHVAIVDKDGEISIRILTGVWTSVQLFGQTHAVEMSPVLFSCKTPQELRAWLS